MGPEGAGVVAVGHRGDKVEEEEERSSSSREKEEEKEE
jgi:hypothetical protein